ncbi:MAG: PilZ domain-containing protein [Bryobacteraceae bacterium]|nr:PilZ domain-containing protein [Bryobacteraceae bacterium]MDW8379793.1 PilZ domain-containing protein [Bryobacterales bacterium]
MNAKPGLRRFERTKVQSRALLSFTGVHGHPVVVRAKVLDASGSGARLEAEAPVEPQTYVQIRVQSPPFAATASVRYCVRHKMDYCLGVEFVGGSKWPSSVEISNPTPQSN